MIGSTAEWQLDEARLEKLLEELSREAARFRFDVAPNPCVGAAVIAGGEVIARGFHEFWGGPHAEVQALERARESGVPASRWDALVVTLEPCSSTGKTPPCVDRIVASGIRRVVVGEVDPDRRHQGAGLRALREAGLEVLLLEGSAPLEKVAPYFLAWNDIDRLRRPHPWTIAKWAQTRTGQLVPPSGVGGGRWISGPESLRDVQVLRGRVDAIVTGVGTVLADDPRLTVRPPGDASRPPLRVVLDSTLRTPPDAALLRAPGPGEGAGEVHILCVGGADATRHRALLDAGAQVHALHVATDDGVSLRDVQSWLWDRGVRRVMIEAGPRVLTHYLESGFVDQVRIYTGDVNGGRGPSMASWLARPDFRERLDREWGNDAVLEAFRYPTRWR
jgi:diaminohydroxyphosphoribosylaminopyrimidine deaminase/5-amino-6-(5-phosphoribosylamino)uracil reductase